MSLQPKRIVFSRKGFDTAAGGCPSPIWDGRMFSLPIPEMLPTKMCYGDIRSPFPELESTGRLVSQLTRGKFHGSFPAHLDPDLRKEALSNRHDEWRAMFGQDNGFQTHLENQGVGAGDLFLFYGLYKNVENKKGSLRFVKGVLPKHVIFGWLCVDGRPLSVTCCHKAPEWARYHSHAYLDCRRKNTLYFASKWIFENLPGSGVFDTFRPELSLTKQGSTSSIWELPNWFDPNRAPNGIPLSGNPYKDAQGRLSKNRGRLSWELIDGKWQLRSKSPGQEFVFSTEYYPEAVKWAEAMIRAGVVS